jgi:hypothetical protein
VSPHIQVADLYPASRPFIVGNRTVEFEARVAGADDVAAGAAGAGVSHRSARMPPPDRAQVEKRRLSAPLSQSE